MIFPHTTNLSETAGMKYEVFKLLMRNCKHCQCYAQDLKYCYCLQKFIFQMGGEEKCKKISKILKES